MTGSYLVVSVLLVPIIVGFVTVLSHTIKWFSCFDVQMSSNCVGLMVDDLVNHEVLRWCFVLFLIMFSYVALVSLIVFWVLFLFIFLDKAS